MFGWGMAGAVALKADELRWIPGQKKMRYDIAGFVTMMKVSCGCGSSCTCGLLAIGIFFTADKSVGDMLTRGWVHPVLIEM